MKPNLAELISRGRNVQMTVEQRLAQRESFAYGSANIENELVNKEIVKEASRRLNQLRETAYHPSSDADESGGDIERPPQRRSRKA